MNAFKVAVVFAMMVGVALSGTCDSVCKTPCTVAHTACNVVASGNALCTMNFEQCNIACDAICSCDNACESQCMPAFTQCQTENANNIIAIAQCPLQLNVCMAQCEGVCAANKAQEAVSQVLGGRK